MDQIGWILLGLCNAAVFVLYGADKGKAVRGAWRIPERVLLWAAVIGPLGALVGMQVFRHKVRKLRFALGVPLILLAEAALLWFLLFR